MINNKKFKDISIIGLAVMGKNLILNIINKDFTVVIYNRTKDKINQLEID